MYFNARLDPILYCTVGALALLLMLSSARAQDEPFGAAGETGAGFDGRIFDIPPNTGRLPDFRTLRPIGTITTRTLDVAPRSFDKGFPGVTGRFEWFAIQYHGLFQIDEPGRYEFRLLSDDGSRLIIDDRVVIDNDGIHGPSTVERAIEIDRGRHCIRVDYFQGPRYHVALQLTARRAEASSDFAPFDVGALQPLLQWYPPPINGSAALFFAQPRPSQPPPLPLDIFGRSAVSPEVAIDILRNHLSGRPPFDPARGRGGASWFVTEGNPYVGAQAAAGERIPLNVRLNVPPDAFLVDSPQLEQVHRLYQPTAATEGLSKVAAYSRTNARNFARGVSAHGEALMWESLGGAATTHPSHTIRVSLQDTYLSRQGNGEFVLTTDPSRIRLETDPLRLHEELFDSGRLQDVSPEVAAELNAGRVRLQAEAARVRNVARVQGVLRVGGRVFLAAGAAHDIYRIYNAPEGARTRTVSQVAGGWVGALAAGKAAAVFLAPSAAAGPVGWIFYGIAVLGAGAGGYWLGATAGDALYDAGSGDDDNTGSDTQCYRPR